MDLILGKRDVGQSAATEWQTKWTPALLQHSDTLTGQQGVLLKQNQKACQGMYLTVLHAYYNYIPHPIWSDRSWDFVCRVIHSSRPARACKLWFLVLLRLPSRSTVNSINTGHEEAEEKLAFLQLCTMLQKKGVDSLFCLSTKNARYAESIFLLQPYMSV